MKLRLPVSPHHKYRLMFAVTVAAYFTSPFLRDRTLGQLLLLCSFLSAMVWVIQQLPLKTVSRQFAHVLGATAVLSETLTILLPMTGSFFSRLSLLSWLSFVGFVSLFIYWTGRDIFSMEDITNDTIYGSILLYLLIGFFWSTFYYLVYQIEPTSFAGVDPQSSQADLTYFSFTTLTTLGYGDITPTQPWTRSITNAESIFGMMYPAIAIARLVGLYQNR